MRTSVYIDGFNFFYWLKPTPYRWIDLKSLVAQALSHPQIRHEITAIKYFTARVWPTRDDPQKHQRQDVYLRALSARGPNFVPIFGEFRRKRKWMRLVTPDGGTGKPVQVWNTEEKGSDVNLAVELMNDACNNAFDLGFRPCRRGVQRFRSRTRFESH